MSARTVFSIAIVVVVLSPLVSAAEESEVVRKKFDRPNVTARPWASLPFIDDVFPLTKEMIKKSFLEARVRAGYDGFVM